MYSEQLNGVLLQLMPDSSIVLTTYDGHPCFISAEGVAALRVFLEREPIAQHIDLAERAIKAHEGFEKLIYDHCR